MSHIKSKYDEAYNTDRYKGIKQICKDRGYPLEQIYYTTEDDYINCAFRISGPKGTTVKQNRV